LKHGHTRSYAGYHLPQVKSQYVYETLSDTAHHSRTGRAYIQAAPIAVVAKKSAIVNGGNIMFEEGWNTKSESTYSVDYSWL